jgi:hypothetical protein
MPWTSFSDLPAAFSSLGILFQLGEAGLVTKIADHVEVMI